MRKMKKLTLGRETLRALDAEAIQRAAGGYPPLTGGGCAVSLTCGGSVTCPASYGCTELNSCQICHQN